MSHPIGETILASHRDRKLKAVEFGGHTVYVKKLKGGEARSAALEADRGDKSIHPWVWAIIAGLCDETGARLFNWGDAERVNELDTADISYLHEAIMEFTNTRRTADEVAKNS